MSQYGLVYHMEFNTMENDQNVFVDIYDTSVLIDDAADPEVIELTPYGSPLVISVINNDRDKFSPIRAKQATIRFLSNRGENKGAYTFADKPDNNWLVRVTNNTPETIFEGFLMLSDIQQPFQPDPVVVELTASDHLGVLKDIPLTDDTGATPQGKYRIAELVAMCLKKTGMSIDLKVINNVRHGGGYTGAITFSQPGNYFVTDGLKTYIFYPNQTIVITGTTSNNGTFIVESVDNTGVVTQVTLTTAITTSESAASATIADASNGHLYNEVYIDAKTFEEEIGTCEDCYTVLEKILGEDCFLTQWKGDWYIMRVDEFEGNPIYIANYDADGTFIDIDGGTTINKSIGAAESIRWANADTLLEFERRHKTVKETYNFNLWKEIVCNIDFSRGTGSDPAGVTPDEEVEYVPECWEFYRGRNVGTGLIMTYTELDTLTADVGALRGIRKIYDFGYEKERFLFMQDNDAEHYYKAEPFDVNFKDRLTISFDWKRMTTLGGSLNQALITLEETDGTLWAWNYNANGSVNEWVEITNMAQSAYLRTWLSTVAGTDDDWENISSVLETPAAGKVTIRLLLNDFGYEKRFANLNIAYDAYINGTYLNFSGQYSQVDRDPAAGYNAKRDEEVFISDSPSKLFKGALMVPSGTDYTLTYRFYAAAVFSLGLPTTEDSYHPFGYIQAFSVWNQYRNSGRVFSGALKGLGTSWPDLLHKYSLTDADGNTVSRNFMLISFEQDWKTGIWTGVFAEVYRTDLGKVYSDTFTFKYITSG